VRDWTITYGGKQFRTRVLDPLPHEQFRRMIRETYPANIGPSWRTRWGHELVEEGLSGSGRAMYGSGVVPHDWEWEHG